ncbi:MAG TPA: DUF6093 family protein [Coriobacteriia bacterium]|nr:DUF6093 family protein [Coriobacteriia bacterium]
MLGNDIAAALPGLRAEAESRMRDTCTVCPVTGVNESTGAPTLGAAIYGPSVAPRYGKCRFVVASVQESDPQAGGATYTVTRGRVDVPVGAFVALTGLVVTSVTSEMDPGLPGRRFRTQAPSPANSQATAYRLAVEEVT